MDLLKSILVIVLIIFNVVSFAAQSENEMQQKIAVENTEKYIDGSNITINLLDDEPFNQEPFNDLILEKTRNNKPYILAIVNQEGMAPFFFDAYSLNQYIFNKYPIYPGLGKWEIEGTMLKRKEGIFGFRPTKNILNNNPLSIYDIHYFIINSLDDIKFHYLISFEDLIQTPEMQTFFYLNTSAKELVYLGDIYHKLKNDKAALEFFEEAIKTPQGLDAAELAHANFMIGRFYYEGGKGVEQDEEKAFEFLKAIKDLQDLKPLERAYAQLWLGRLYYIRYNNEDYERSRKLLEEAIKNPQYFSTKNLGITNYILGLIYYHGRGVEKDYQKAHTLLEKALTQLTSQRNLKTAQSYLADIRQQISQS